jgi:16S rRNA (cytosine967-C5)-methyltransferase
MPGFDTGRVSVQDAHAQLAAPLLVGAGADRLPAGARVLDACCAPGGKTAHLLELADLDVLGLDVDGERLGLAAATLQRLGLRAQLQAADAADTAAWWDGRPFDAILLDAPCSAAGIVRRHPDIRWLRREADIAALAATQARLLDMLWPLLAPGGRMVFATCSVFAAEGRHQIEAFLQRTTSARLRPSPGHLLPLADNGSAPGDGFFYARLDRTV